MNYLGACLHSNESLSSFFTMSQMCSHRRCIKRWPVYQQLTKHLASSNRQAYHRKPVDASTN